MKRLFFFSLALLLCSASASLADPAATLVLQNYDTEFYKFAMPPNSSPTEENGLLQAGGDATVSVLLVLLPTETMHDLESLQNAEDVYVQMGPAQQRKLSGTSRLRLLSRDAEGRSFTTHDDGGAGKKEVYGLQFPDKSAMVLVWSWRDAFGDDKAHLLLNGFAASLELKKPANQVKHI